MYFTSKFYRRIVFQVDTSDPNPDTLVRGPDPRIRIVIRTKCHGSATLVPIKLFSFCGNAKKVLLPQWGSCTG
jgi:hypothetical protein